jgi:hypothetical protein
MAEPSITDSASPESTARETALSLAAEAVRTTSHAERRDLEQAALRSWQAARVARKAVRA